MKGENVAKAAASTPVTARPREGRQVHHRDRDAPARSEGTRSASPEVSIWVASQPATNDSGGDISASECTTDQTSPSPLVVTIQ